MKLDDLEKPQYSSYIHCNQCKAFGSPIVCQNGEECGNCSSKETVAYMFSIQMFSEHWDICE